MRRFLAFALFAFCASAIPAAAARAESSPRPGSLVWSELLAGLDLRAAIPLLRSDSDVTRVRAVSGRAIARGFAGVKLWAKGTGYAVGRRAGGYGLQGGAAWALDDSIDFTASYRLIGFSLGDGLDSELADVQERSGAPFVGVDISF